MIYSLTGKNAFLLKKELDDLVAAFVKDYGDLALEKFEAEELELARLVEAVQSVPFLSAKKMVVVRDLSANKLLTENIEQVLDAQAESTDLIIYDPRADKRTSYYKTLVKRTNHIEFNELDEQALARWLSEEAKNQGATISQTDALFLVQYVGLDQQLVKRTGQVNKL